MTERAEAIKVTFVGSQRWGQGLLGFAVGEFAEVDGSDETSALKCVELFASDF